MRKFSFIILLLVPILCFSQEKSPKQEIRALKNSMLLVRLRTSNNKIEALIKSGHPDKAEKTEEKQKQENLKIAKAFAENFTFCPVYFFYSSATSEIKSFHFSGNLMNSELKTLKGIKKPVADFFVAEFTQIERYDGKYYDYTSLEKNEEGYSEKRKNYYGSPDMGFNALVIRDAKFRQLGEPFPFYIRTYESLPIFRRRTAKTVFKLNNQLINYYRMVKN